MKTDPRSLVIRRHWVLNNMRGQFEDRSECSSHTQPQITQKAAHIARGANSRNLGGGSHKTQWHATGGLCSNGTFLGETSEKILFLPLSIVWGHMCAFWGHSIDMYPGIYTETKEKHWISCFITLCLVPLKQSLLLNPGVHHLSASLVVQQASNLLVCANTSPFPGHVLQMRTATSSFYTWVLRISAHVLMQQTVLATSHLEAQGPLFQRNGTTPYQQTLFSVVPSVKI